MLIDTHAHLFLEEFVGDLPQVIARARAAGVDYVLMPNIDSTTIAPMLDVCRRYAGYCFPMMGLHPTSVNDSVEQELAVVRRWLSGSDRHFVAVGEIGLDFYWDQTFRKEQLRAFDTQLQWALEADLPVVIHVREAFKEVFNILSAYKQTALRGVFHSFTGGEDEAVRCLEFDNFLLGINGIVTFKKSHLPEVLRTVLPLDRLLLETDAPYLTPVPNRGKRNESSHIVDTLAKVAEVYGVGQEEVCRATSENALRLFGMPAHWKENA